MIYDCELCHKGTSVETIENCYNEQLGVCAHCYAAVVKAVVDKRERTKKEKAKELSIGVSVDTTQIDEAMVKVEQLAQCLERADALLYRIKKEMVGVVKPFSVGDITVTLDPMTIDKVKEELAEGLRNAAKREIDKIFQSPPLFL